MLDQSRYYRCSDNRAYVSLEKPQLPLRLFYVSSFSIEIAARLLCDGNKGDIGVLFVSIGVFCAALMVGNIFKKKAAKTAKVYPLVAANLV